MASFLFGVVGVCAVAAAILHLLMLREMRDETGRWLLAFHLFVDKQRFTRRGLLLRRWRFFVVGVAVGCIILSVALEAPSLT